MLLDVQENLIDQSRESLVIDNQIQSFLESNEGQNIKSDIDLLVQMGFDKKMINKVYILLRPENIDRAIDYMTDVGGIYQHDFLASTNPKEKTLCFICKKPKQNHLDYIPDDLLNEDQNIDLINNEDDIIDNDELIIENKDNHDECDVCYDEINEEDKKLNTIPCGHLFCTHCWFNYLKTLIVEAKVDKIKCMDHECKEVISEDFILKHISENENLINKYHKFKKRAEIISDKNKKLCPKADCDSYLEKSSKSKYVQCENGHQFCYECLKPPHGKDPCDQNLEKQFMKWKKGKRVKRCPRCQMYTEKNEGCNHMTCVSCKYQWCWLCEGEYNYNHYSSGRCKGQQFTRADNLKQIEVYKHIPGLHKIFSCIFKPINGPFSTALDDLVWFKYIQMLIFWIFGPLVIFLFAVLFYRDEEILMNDDCAEIFFIFIIIFTGAALYIPFAIVFACTAAPLMLICFINHKFFGKILILYGIGDSYSLN
jgi:hypothetical protein